MAITEEYIYNVIKRILTYNNIKYTLLNVEYSHDNYNVIAYDEEWQDIVQQVEYYKITIDNISFWINNSEEEESIINKLKLN